MNKRDLKADLEAIREGATLFGDSNPSVNTQYELYEVAEHALERAIKAEALARRLVEALEKFIVNVAWELTEQEHLLNLAKEVLEDD